MAEPFRGLQISRRSWLLAGLATPLFPGWAAESLAVTFDGDNLHVSAPDLHFLAGKPLERLKQGSATVQYAALVTLYSDRFTTPIRRTDARFVVSYDIWQEDKFSVSMTRPVTRSASELPAAAAEAWCLERIVIGTSGMVPDHQFWLQLDLAVIGAKDLSSVLGPGINLTRVLVDLFSQKPGTADPRWMRQAGPLRLADLARPTGRGQRNL